MPAKDLGVKHTCFKCGTRFYDLKKPEVICPKCGADQKDSPALRTPAVADKRARPPKQPAKEPVEDLVDETDLEEDADESAEEDVEEPGEDEDT
jgi:uncharacterized protein (TIGR02300 family)